MVDLIKPKEVQVKNMDGEEKTFIISRLPATLGREVVTQYLLTALPKVGDYRENERQMFNVLKYVAIKTEEGQEIRLTTQALIDNHAGDWETLAKLEAGMAEYNISFFGDGRASISLEGIVQKFLKLAMKTLTDFSAQSSKKS